MLKMKDLLFESDIEKFRSLKGSYTLQGHVSSKKGIDLKNLNPDDVTISGIEPLPPRGFWTSTVFKDLDTFTTRWAEWRYDERYSDIDFKPTYYVHVYTIRGNPRIKHVKSEEDADEFVQNYHRDFNEDEIDWKKIAKEYDAVHVVGKGLESYYFKNWDIESTVWFNPKDYLKEQFLWKVSGDGFHAPSFQKVNGDE